MKESIATLLAVASLACVSPDVIADEQWSAPVRILNSSQQAQQESPTESMRPPAGDSTGRLPPQYLTGLLTNESAERSADDATIRFLVSLVERPISVEATVMVDGVPFRKVREKRIDELLSELKAIADEPPGQKVEAVVANVETKNESGAGEGKLPEADTLGARLNRYVTATKRTPGPDELRWLATNWMSGPPVLFLDENFQRVRSAASPLFAVLDRDGDERLSVEEIGEAEATLWKFDRNQDEVITFRELARAGDRAPSVATNVPRTAPLIRYETLNTRHVWQQFSRRYPSSVAPFDADQDGRISESEASHLAGLQPDIRLTVHFLTEDAGKSRIEVSLADRSVVEGEPLVSGPSINLQIAGTRVEFAAVQPNTASLTEHISVGGVEDGYPLLPAIDTNEDGRLTIRELRRLSPFLGSFDRTNDGAIDRGELLPTVRIAIGLGPIVHQHLASVRGSYSTSALPAVTAPEWFTRMDRNKDEDLTTREFLGAPEQFAALDSDQDGLISSQEAATAKD